MSFKMLPAMKILLAVILAVSYCMAENGSSVRILGGNNVTIEQFPYQVALIINELYCGGIIISEKWVMTAAHCFRMPISVIHAGSTYYDSGSVHKIVKKVLHRKFGFIRGHPVNDIALVQVFPEFTFSDKIRPAKLPRQYEEVDEHSSVVITGWGRLWQYGQISQRLQSVEVDVITNKRCQMLYFTGKILPNMFCTMMEHSGIGPCFGDHGGPVLTQDKVVIGIVSWRYSCAGVNFPAVYTKVSYFREWISEVTGV